MSPSVPLHPRIEDAILDVSRPQITPEDRRNHPVNVDILRGAIRITYGDLLPIPEPPAS